MATVSLKTRERQLPDLMAELEERDDVRRGVPLPLGTDPLQEGINFAMVSREAVPFAPEAAVSVAQEIDRVVPVIEALRDTARAVISVDTFRPEVARRSIAAGAHVINDTSGLHLSGTLIEADCLDELSNPKPRVDLPAGRGRGNR